MNAKRKMDDDMGGEKRKGRKKGFVWSHVVTDDEGKVTCLHCGDLIKVNFGEKVRNDCRFILRCFYFLILLCSFPTGRETQKTFHQVVHQEPVSKGQ